ncbi:MAG: DegQ family serine endoprotease [Syntrophorhabdaceae bacterium]|nr:DegQ family serine endoprotease [Syntrophorhabdaceae bacterium]
MERRRVIRAVVVTLVTIALTVGLGYGVSKAVKGTDPAPAVSKSAGGVPVMVPGNFTTLAEKVRPSVVNIQTVKTLKGNGRVFRHFFGNPFGGQNPFEEFFGPRGGNGSPEDFRQKSLGSGFIIDGDGYIATNNHVVEGANEIKVKLADGREFDASVVGRDPKTDLALIRIKGASNLMPINMGNSDELKVGSWVVAIGSPFGLEQTVTAGIVSAKGRIIGSGPYDNFIQTDASINPGNSGGPLINMNGEVIGINTAIVASGQGIGFAIPIDTAKSVIAQLKGSGSVTRGWLGVSIQEITPALASSFGLKDRKGALVADVVKDGPADKAGIAQGDVIVEFDGKEIASSNDLPRIVAATPVGKDVAVKLLRNGTTAGRTVKIARMEDTVAEAAEKVTGGNKVGITVQGITPEVARALQLKNRKGVVVASVEPGSPAEEAGIVRGDVIREVNRAAVKDVESFVRKMEQESQQKNVLFLISRKASNIYVVVKLDKN